MCGGRMGEKTFLTTLTNGKKQRSKKKEETAKNIFTNNLTNGKKQRSKKKEETAKNIFMNNLKGGTHEVHYHYDGDGK